MSGAKILSLAQLKAKKYSFLDGLDTKIVDSFGMLTRNFSMIIWGHSGNGKTNLIIQLVRNFLAFGDVLYVSYEEGTEATMQRTALLHLDGDFACAIRFADHTMSFEELQNRLRRKRSEQFIIIDSLQYSRFKYSHYILLKEEFCKKSFIYISHAKGKLPKGGVADDIRYDVAIKVFVEKYIAFIISRFGSKKPYVIWEEGAMNHHGKKEFDKLTKAGSKTKTKTKLENQEELDL